MIALLLLLACKAESLGVDVPHGGPDAISQEDLQRDVFMLTERGLEDRSPTTRGGTEAHRRVSERLQQMHLLPAFGDAYDRPGGLLCGQKEGRSGKGVLVAAEDSGSGAASAAAVAAIISLGKAFDVRDTPTDTLIFCAWPATGGLEAWLTQPAMPMADLRRVILLSNLAGPIQTADQPPVQGRPTTRVSGLAPADNDTMDRLDYRALEAAVGDIYALVVAP